MDGQRGKTRPAAVAGTFYPADAGELESTVATLLDRAVATAPVVASWPKALIAPHAGYTYSGAVAAAAHARLLPGREVIRRVVLVGPSHFARCDGLALPAADAFETPLGRLRLDAPALAELADLPQVVVSDAAHRREHSLEVHLPFLQHLLPSFTLVPLAVGQAGAREVAEVLERLWDGEETVLVVSSDLSHNHDYASARRLDAATARLIEAACPRELAGDEACGSRGINGLARIVRRRGLAVERLAMASSGDAGGGSAEVVGYGAWAVG